MIVVENVIVVVVVVIVLFLHFLLSFSSVLSTLFCTNKMGKTTAATSFPCLRGDIIHHKGSGIKEVFNLHRIPPQKILLWAVLRLDL